MVDDLIPNQIITIAALLLGLVCIYASSIEFVGGLVSIIATVLAVLWATNTLRHIGKYSLGTGVPSIVYMLSSVGLVGYIAGMISSIYFNIQFLFPVLSIIISVIIAFTVSLICKHIFNIQVEILTKSFIGIAVASMLTVLALSTLIAHTWQPTSVLESVVINGMIIPLMIMSVMAIQNPYNSCMGSNEDQIRTLALSCSNAFIMLIIASILSMLSTQYWAVYLLISAICWFMFFRQYLVYSKQQAASVKRYGLWPTDDGDE